MKEEEEEQGEAEETQTEKKGRDRTEKQRLKKNALFPQIFQKALQISQSISTHIIQNDALIKMKAYKICKQRERVHHFAAMGQGCPGQMQHYASTGIPARTPRTSGSDQTPLETGSLFHRLHAEPTAMHNMFHKIRK